MASADLPHDDAQQPRPEAAVPETATTTATPAMDSAQAKGPQNTLGAEQVPAEITASSASSPTARTGPQVLSQPHAPSLQSAQPSQATTTGTDPLDLSRHKRENISKRQMQIEHPKGDKRKLKKYYTRQNELIDQFLGADDEEANQVEDEAKYRPRIRFAVHASFVVNFCLFIIQLYAAVSTGSLSLFATAADAFMDLVSSFVMLITSKLAARPSVYKYPVGRRRIETIGIILFCALMTTVAIELLIESIRTLAGGPTEAKQLQIVPLTCVGIAIFAKSSLMLYCFTYRRFSTVHVFFVDHRNDVVVNIFGLVMSIVGDRFVWFLDPIGAILIALLILFSWVSNAFEQVWLLVGKSAPREFISKLIYMTVTHDTRINKVDTCRAYHAGEKYYVEIDVVMDENLPLRVTHDVGQTLQRKLEGLADVERAFVHIDYDNEHDINQEHKPLYEKRAKRTLKDLLLFRKPQMEESLVRVQEILEPRSSTSTAVRSRHGHTPEKQV